jgi:hypothetical protein
LGSGSVSPILVIGAGGSTTVAFGACQIVEFDSQSDAVAFYNSHTFLQNAPETLRRVKIGSTPRSTTTTLSDDEYLADFPLEANTVYDISGVLYIDGVNAASDYKHKWNYSAAPSNINIAAFIIETGTGIQGTSVWTADTTSSVFINTGTPLIVRIYGRILSDSGGPSTMSYQWAQNISTAINTSVLSGSWIEVRKAFDPS